MKQPIFASFKASLAATVAAALAACGGPEAPHNLLTSSAGAPPEIQQACALANMRCAHCHPIDRVLVARGVGVRRWQMFIDEMRAKPSSGISPDDANIIFRCMRFIEEGVKS